jgi:hypothetical protein
LGCNTLTISKAACTACQSFDLCAPGTSGAEQQAGEKQHRV